jgi:hypothetical protein
MKQIDILPDEALLEIFDFCTVTDPPYASGGIPSDAGKKATEAWQLLVHVSTMEKPCSWITTSSEPATFLYIQNTHKGHTGRLASLTSCR